MGKPGFGIAMDTEGLCLWCNTHLSEGSTVTVSTGLGTIINSSIRQKDGLAGKLEGLSSIFLMYMWPAVKRTPENLALCLWFTLLPGKSPKL